MAPRYEPLDWYDAPKWYDIVFDEGTRTEADFLEYVRRQFVGGDGRRVLEPACGSGRLVAELARRGYCVSGFDGNIHMVEFARQRMDRLGLDADIQLGSLESFSYPTRFELAHCLVSTFKYILDETRARVHLEHVAKALVPGGVYVLGLHLSEYDVTTRTRERWVGRRGGTSVVCNIQQWPPDPRCRLERVRARLTVQNGRSLRRFETNWQFRSYSARQVKRLVRSVPALAHVATYDFTYDVNGPIPLDGKQLDVVLILQRREEEVVRRR
jgi:SAM-dependent methyltransferase